MRGRVHELFKKFGSVELIAIKVPDAPALIELLRVPRAAQSAADVLDSIDAAWAASEEASRAVPPLVEALRGNRIDAHRCVSLLAKIGARAAVELEDLLTDPRQFTRLAAARVLAPRDAVRALCSVDSPATSNVLHLVAQLQDLSIASNPNCLGEGFEVSRETLRRLAREELARRGNPRYRPEAYLRPE